MPASKPSILEEGAVGEGFYDAAKGVRYVKVGVVGHERLVPRPVAASLEEAKAKGWDFHHPQLGWIRRGRKVEKDYPENDGYNYIPTPGGGG